MFQEKSWKCSYLEIPKTATYFDAKLGCPKECAPIPWMRVTHRYILGAWRRLNTGQYSLRDESKILIHFAPDFAKISKIRNMYFLLYNLKIDFDKKDTLVGFAGQHYAIFLVELTPLSKNKFNFNIINILFLLWNVNILAALCCLRCYSGPDWIAIYMFLGSCKL